MPRLAAKAGKGPPSHTEQEGDPAALHAPRAEQVQCRLLRSQAPPGAAVS